MEVAVLEQSQQLKIVKCHCKSSETPSQNTVKFSFKVSLGNSGSEHCIEEYLKYWKFNTNIIDLGSLKLNVK
jgi:hypothetical protein